MIIANPDSQPIQEKGPLVPPKDSAQTEQLPPPPPYSPPERPAAGPSSVPRSPQRSGSSSISHPQNAQTVNRFELFSKHNPISGTYLVDPLLPTPNIHNKLRKRRERAWGKSARPTEPHASFRTRHGAISLDLAVVAETGLVPGAQKERGCIVVSSRHGRINVNLFEIQPGRSVDLHVESRHGKILVLLPPTYDGPIMFNTRSISAVTFLPAFAARTRTLRAADRQTLVICTPPEAEGHPGPTPTTPGHEEEEGNRTLISTRHGRIMVGISGVDRVEDAPSTGGLFRRLGELFEVGGRVLGQYVEAHAAVVEKRLAEGRVIMEKSLEGKMRDRGAVARP